MYVFPCYEQKSEYQIKRLFLINSNHEGVEIYLHHWIQPTKVQIFTPSTINRVKLYVRQNIL